MESTRKDFVGCQAFKSGYYQENIGLSVFYVLLSIIALPLIIAGYRFHHVTFFSQTFAIVSLTTYILLDNFVKLDQPIKIVCAVAMGMLLGICSIPYRIIGYIFSSLIQSIFIAAYIILALKPVINQYYNQYYIIICIILLIWLILFGLNFKWKHAVSILFITSYGIILIIIMLDYFMNNSYLWSTAYKVLLHSSQSILEPCWFPWGLLVAWPVLMLFSLVQFKFTAKNVSCSKKGQYTIMSSLQMKLASKFGLQEKVTLRNTNNTSNTSESQNYELDFYETPCLEESLSNENINKKTVRHYHCASNSNMYESMYSAASFTHDQANKLPPSVSTENKIQDLSTLTCSKDTERDRSNESLSVQKFTQYNEYYQSMAGDNGKSKCTDSSTLKSDKRRMSITKTHSCTSLYSKESDEIIKGSDDDSDYCEINSDNDDKKSMDSCNTFIDNPYELEERFDSYQASTVQSIDKLGRNTYCEIALEDLGRNTYCEISTQQPLQESTHECFASYQEPEICKSANALNRNTYCEIIDNPVQSSYNSCGSYQLKSLRNTVELMEKSSALQPLYLLPMEKYLKNKKLNNTKKDERNTYVEVSDIHLSSSSCREEENKMKNAVGEESRNTYVEIDDLPLQPSLPPHCKYLSLNKMSDRNTYVEVNDHPLTNTCNNNQMIRSMKDGSRNTYLEINDYQHVEENEYLQPIIESYATIE